MPDARKITLLNNLISPLSKPIYVLRMGGARMSEEKFLHWVRELREQADRVKRRCDAVLEPRCAFCGMKEFAWGRGPLITPKGVLPGTYIHEPCHKETFMGGLD